MFAVLHTERGQVSFAVIALAAVGMLFLVIGSVMQLQRPTVISITPTMTHQTERCLTCHEGIEAISASHSTAEFGCVSCHGGDRLAVDEDAAHTGLVANPASAENAQQYCGTCHAAQVVMVERSIMTTYAGAISLIRRAYGLQADGSAEYAANAVAHLKAFSASTSDPDPVKAFAANCQSCHTSSEPTHADYFYRSTGCSTCHVLYNADGLYEGGDPTITKTEAGHAQLHEFTTAIPYTQCNHCHNRGNVDLRTMTFIPRDDMPADPELAGNALTDDLLRLHDYYQPVGQFTRCEYELDCIDCHTQREVMGDGVLYNNRTEAQYTQCQTCHGTLDSPPLEKVVQSDGEQAMILANANPNVDLAVGDTIMMTDHSEPLYNIQLEGDQWILTGKATGETYVVPLVQGSTCQQDPNEQSSASCHQCHSVDRGESP